MSNNHVVRHKLISARKELGITQNELAEYIGISRAYLTNIERGRNEPSLKIAIALSKKLGKTLDWLFSDSSSGT